MRAASSATVIARSESRHTWRQWRNSSGGSGSYERGTAGLAPINECMTTPVEGRTNSDACTKALTVIPPTHEALQPAKPGLPGATGARPG